MIHIRIERETFRAGSPQDEYLILPLFAYGIVKDFIPGGRSSRTRHVREVTRMFFIFIYPFKTQHHKLRAIKYYIMVSE